MRPRRAGASGSATKDRKSRLQVRSHRKPVQGAENAPLQVLLRQDRLDLFDRICELDEYYPTRTEIALLERHGEEFAELSGPACHVIEFGSGSSVKVKLLLDKLNEPSTYTAIDISKDHLIDATTALAEEFPEIDVEAVWADYSQPLRMSGTAMPAAGSDSSRARPSAISRRTRRMRFSSARPRPSVPGDRC